MEYTDNKLSKILLAAVIVLLIAVIVLGIAFYVQSKKVSKISDVFFPSGNGAASQTAPAAAQPAQPGSEVPDYIVQDAKKNLSENVKQISGTVTGANGNTLTVEAEIVDVGNLNKENIKQNKVPTVKKSYIVTTDEKTEFARKKLPDIKTGDGILVKVNELVYQTDKLTAAKIICPIDLKKLQNQLQNKAQ